MQRAERSERLDEITEDQRFGAGAVIGLDRLPRLRLCCLEERDDLVREQCAAAVEFLGIALLVPALGDELRRDEILEGQLGVLRLDLGRYPMAAVSRTSILPVTAAVMRAERYSMRRPAATSNLRISSSSF